MRSIGPERQGVADGPRGTYARPVIDASPAELSGAQRVALRVLAMAPDELRRAGLRRMLDDAGLVAVYAPSAADVVVADAEPGGMTMHDLERVVADARSRGVAVVAVCAVEDGAEEAALARGADGAVTAAVDAEQLGAVVRTVGAGSMVLPGRAGRRMAERLEAHQSFCACDRLTPREREVLGLLARGLENHEIARELVVTASTVKHHAARILAKMGARNRTHAAVIAVERGCLSRA